MAAEGVATDRRARCLMLPWRTVSFGRDNAALRDRRIVLALAVAIALGTGGCKRTAPEPDDGTPRATLRGFTPIPSKALPQGETSPPVVALTSNGLNLLAVSATGDTLVDNVSGVSRIPLGLDKVPTHPPVRSATFADSSIVAVGPGGVIVRRSDGETAWRAETSPVPAALYGVAATAEWIVAVGAGGTIVARRNTTRPEPWTKIPAPTGEDLFAVSPCNRAPTTRICAVGAHGVLLVSAEPEGLAFRAVPTGTTEALRALTPTWPYGPTHAVGDRGTIVAIDEQGARLVPSGTTADLTSVASDEIERSKLEGSFGAVVVVGKRGTVLVQTSGRGKVSPFRPLRLPTTDDLVAITSSKHMTFVIAPRDGRLHDLSLDGGARHSFPPD